MKCNWTENVLNKDSLQLEIKECDNTNTIKDDGNVKDRWFCIDKDNHIEEVKKVRKLMHKDCISKEKLIKMIKPNCKSTHYYGYCSEKERFSFFLLKEIENGDFDNDL